MTYSEKAKQTPHTTLDKCRCNNCEEIVVVRWDEDECPCCKYDGGLADIKQDFQADRY